MPSSLFGFILVWHFRVTKLAMVVNAPTEVIAHGFFDRRCNFAKVERNMVLESVVADELEEVLHSVDFHNSKAAKRIENVIG